MNTGYKIVLFSVYFLFVLYGCHKQGSPVIKAKGFAISSYPFDVGDKWTYQVTEEVYQYTDTVIFEVISKSIVGTDTLYKTQTSRNGAVYDSTVVIKTQNSITYLPAIPVNSLFDSLWIVFPLSDTIQTYGYIPSDTALVTDVNLTLNILGINYTNMTQIKQEISNPTYRYVNLVAICPNIGIVQENLYVNYGYATKTETILLISYEIH